MARLVFIRNFCGLIKLLNIFVILVLDFATAPSEGTLAVILTNDDAKIQTTNIDAKKSKNCNN